MDKQEQWREEFEEWYFGIINRPNAHVSKEEKRQSYQYGEMLAGYEAGRKKGEVELKEWTDVHGRLIAKVNEEKRQFVDSYREEITQIKKISNGEQEIIITLTLEIQQLKNELKRERECVDFYANKERWQSPMDQGFSHKYNLFNEEDLHDMIDNDDDGICAGKRAREVQAKRKVL